MWRYAAGIARAYRANFELGLKLLGALMAKQITLYYSPLIRFWIFRYRYQLFSALVTTHRYSSSI